MVHYSDADIFHKMKVGGNLQMDVGFLVSVKVGVHLVTDAGIHSNSKSPSYFILTPTSTSWKLASKSNEVPTLTTSQINVIFNLDVCF